MTDHSSMNHSMMDHGSMDHGSMDHSSMNHSMMDHSSMDHGSMDHGSMDHGSMDHGSMDHGSMDHSVVDNGVVHHGVEGHGMKMYFHAGSSATILFEPWKTTNWQQMLGSCIAIFIMAALYEGLKCWREILLRNATSNRSGRMAVATSEDKETTIVDDGTARVKMLSLPHAIQTLLHIIQIVVSYFLMLIFMTYNVWLCLAVALGAGAGYFLFNWRRSVVIDINEHCH